MNNKAPILTRHSLRLILLSSLMLGILGACTSLTGQQDSVGSMQVKEHARRGDMQSQYRMGLLYTSSEPQDYKKAAKWFRKAARQGHQEAQYMLGIAYYTGRGIPLDYSKALEWFQKSADQGYARAQYQLGEMYMNGRGTLKDTAWAALWYGKGADQAHTEAQFSLGIAFARGLGLPVNRVRSCQWLVLAEQSGQASAAAVKEKICTALSAKQRKRAKYLAARWKVRAYPADQDPPTLRYIQFRLQQLGYKPGYVDGVNGEQTSDAVQTYLHESGLNGETISIESLITRLREDS